MGTSAIARATSETVYGVTQNDTRGMNRRVRAGPHLAGQARLAAGVACRRQRKDSTLASRPSTHRRLKIKYWQAGDDVSSPAIPSAMMT